MSTEEQVLCVHADRVKYDYGQWNPYLVKKSIADDKVLVPVEHQQIIPYVVLYRDNENGQVELLHYVREKKSGEQRLIDRISCGLGGHVNDLPPAIDHNPQYRYEHEEHVKYRDALIAHLTEHTVRELCEELPGFFNPEDAQLKHLIAANITLRNFIQLNVNNVSKVHLGIVIHINVADVDCNQNALSGEEGHVGNLTWRSIEETKSEELQSKYEDWTKYVLEDIYKKIEDAKRLFVIDKN